MNGILCKIMYNLLGIGLKLRSILFSRFMYFFFYWLLLSIPFILFSILFDFKLRFVLPLPFIGLLIFLVSIFPKKIISRFVTALYMILLFFSIADTVLILFQHRTFDIRFFNLLSFESVKKALQLFPLYSTLLTLFFILSFFIVYMIFRKIEKRGNIDKKGPIVLVASTICILILLILTPNSFSLFIWKFLHYQKYKKTVLQCKLPKINLYASVSSKKKNLLLIYLESYEKEFIEKKYFNNLSPFLQQFWEDSVSFENDRMIPGADFTIAGMVASQCGTVYYYKDTKNLICLGDVLHKAGYYQVYMGAADLEYEHKGDFYRKHHYNELYGKKELPSHSKQLNSWGIYDDELFEYVYKKFLELNKNYLRTGKLFNITLITIDTHNGTPSPSCPRYVGKFSENHFFQSYHCTDYLLKKLIKKILSTPGSDSLVIAILGDHLQNFDIYASKLKHMNRRVLVLIYDGKHNKKITQKTAHIDFVQTLLPLLNIKTNAKFMFGGNALKKLDKNHINKIFVNKKDFKLRRMINAENWITAVGISSGNSKRKIKSLYSYGADIKNISRSEIEKYFFPNIEKYRNFSTDNYKAYYSVDDNMLFFQTKKFFRTIHIYLETQNGSYYDGNIHLKDAVVLPDNWYVWVFGNHFHNVCKLKLNISELHGIFSIPNKISVLDNTVIKNFKYGLVIKFNKPNPKPLEQAVVILRYKKDISKAKFVIYDTYNNISYRNRIKYKVIYRNNVILQEDIASNKKSFIDIKLSPNDHKIMIIMQAQKNIENNWQWGKAVNLKVSFYKED